MLIPKVINLLKPFADTTLDAENENACISRNNSIEQENKLWVECESSNWYWYNEKWIGHTIAYYT